MQRVEPKFGTINVAGPATLWFSKPPDPLFHWSSLWNFVYAILYDKGPFTFKPSMCSVRPSFFAYFLIILAEPFTSALMILPFEER